MSKDQLEKMLENPLLPDFAKDEALDMLIELEIKELVGHPAYDTLTARYGKGEGLGFISRYVKSLVKEEGFEIGSAIAQFDSNF